MDPVTAIGLAGAIVGIIDVTTKSIQALRALHTQYKEADMNLSFLISQMTALRAALTKISEWISLDLTNSPQHHQLVMDLEDSVSCCKMLVKTIDDQIATLNVIGINSMEFSRRLKMVFQGRASEDLQKFIGRQTSALTLLLTACNCRTATEQKALLERRSSRRVLDDVQDSSSSLIVLHDTASCYSNISQSTGRSSKLSIIFPFDSQLTGSRVYQNAIRSLFKRSYRPNGGASNLVQNLRSDVSEKPNENATETLERHVQTSCGVLVLSAGGHGRTAILVKMRSMSEGGYNKEERVRYLPEVLAMIVDCWIAIGEICVLCDFNDLSKVQRARIKALRKMVWPLRLLSKHSQEVLLGTLREIFNLLQRSQEWRETGFWISSISPRLFYFFQNVDRIVEADYLPNDADICQLPVSAHHRSVEVSTLTMGGTKIEVNSIEPQNESTSILNIYTDIVSLVFIVDLSSYFDKRLLITLRSFEEFVNYSRCERLSVILLLDNIEFFHEKLRRVPLRTCFPEYLGNDTSHEATSYVVERFQERNRKTLTLYPYVAEPTNTSILVFLFAAVNETLRVRKDYRPEQDYMSDEYYSSENEDRPSKKTHSSEKAPSSKNDPP